MKRERTGWFTPPQVSAPARTSVLPPVLPIAASLAGTLLLAFFLVLAGPARPARAMLHPLGGLTHNATNNVSTLDFTVSLGWNWYGPPTGTWNRTTFTTRMDAFAKSLFAMTEGRHRVGKIYVYPSGKAWSKVDIRFVSNRSGTSAANVADWRKATGNIEMYLWENATSKDSFIGPVLAHECGHYVYGVYDEYRNRHPGAKPHRQLDGPDLPGLGRLRRHALDHERPRELSPPVLPGRELPQRQHPEHRPVAGLRRVDLGHPHPLPGPGPGAGQERGPGALCGPGQRQRAHHPEQAHGRIRRRPAHHPHAERHGERAGL